MKKVLVGAIFAKATALSAFTGLRRSTSAADDLCGKPVNGGEHSSANPECYGHGSLGAFGKDKSLAGGAD